MNGIFLGIRLFIKNRSSRLSVCNASRLVNRRPQRPVNTIKDIEGQLGWTVHLPWSADMLSTSSGYDGLRLFRQSARNDGSSPILDCGRSRAAATVAHWMGYSCTSQRDFSSRSAAVHRSFSAQGVHYGPVYFHDESEPFMILAMAGGRRGMLASPSRRSISKLIWTSSRKSDVVAQRLVAYVIDERGAPRSHCPSRYQPGPSWAPMSLQTHRVKLARGGADTTSLPSSPMEKIFIIQCSLRMRRLRHSAGGFRQLPLRRPGVALRRDCPRGNLLLPVAAIASDVARRDMARPEDGRPDSGRCTLGAARIGRAAISAGAFP